MQDGGYRLVNINRWAHQGVRHEVACCGPKCGPCWAADRICFLQLQLEPRQGRCCMLNVQQVQLLHQYLACAEASMHDALSHHGGESAVSPVCPQLTCAALTGAVHAV
jgi:hypothetical protein